MTRIYLYCTLRSTHHTDRDTTVIDQLREHPYKALSIFTVRNKIPVDDKDLPIVEDGGDFTIASLVSIAKNKDMDIVQLRIIP